MFKVLYSLILLVCFQFSAIAGESPAFHKVKAQKGEGIFSLLRKYDLIDQKCNLTKFCELNEMDLKDQLIVGKKYHIPVYIYTYNGKSIRSTIGNNDLEKAKRIQHYNETIKAKGLRKTHFIDSKILWVPFHELGCETPSGAKNETINVVQSTTKPKKNNSPASTMKTLYLPLFGDAHKNIEIKSNDLKNKVYYLVSGHGGPDPGAMCIECPVNLCEDEYAYDVTLRLAKKLLEQGATVHMIIRDKNDGIRDDKYLQCDRDELCLDSKIPLRQKVRLQQRASAINNLYKMYKKKGIKEQYAVMVHVDSRGEQKRQDTFFYYYRGSKSSKALAKNMHGTFKNKYETLRKNRGYKGYIKQRGLYMLYNTLPTAVYVELANIKNKNDQKRILLKENRQLLADWLYEGLVK